MSPEEIVSGALEVFRTDIESPPPLTLRGGNAVDGYSQAVPFDAAEDEPTDAYFEAFLLGSRLPRRPFVAPLSAPIDRLCVPTSERSRHGCRGAGAIAASSRPISAAAGGIERRPGVDRAVVS